MRPPARAGINALFLEPEMGGLVTYVLELVGELVQVAPSTRLTVLCNATGRELLQRAPWAGEVAWRTPPLLSRRGLRMVTEVGPLGALASARFDVVHSPALTAPLATRAANVVVLADVTWIVQPTGGQVGRTEQLWRAVVPHVARRADRVLAISQDSAQQVLDHLPVQPDRVDVVPLGVGAPPPVTPTPAADLRAGLGLGDGPVVLHLGAKKVHKNQIVLVRALPELLAADPATRLVLAGSPSAYDDELRAEARRLGVDQALCLLGFVDDADLEGLYATAACFAFPSLNEGFGLPVLEAMIRGVPVVCSDLSAMPEVAGDAALLVDPRDAVAVAGAVRRVLGDVELRERLVARGRARAAGFSWRATAEGTLESWERAMAHRGR